MSKTTTEQTRICGQCGNERPLSDFRRNRRGEASRAPQCRTCHNLNMRLSRAKKRSRDIEGFSRRLQDERDSLRVRALCNGMLQKFGGVPGLVETWHAEYESAPTGSRQRLAILQAVIRLIEVTQGRVQR